MFAFITVLACGGTHAKTLLNADVAESTCFTADEWCSKHRAT